MHTFFMTIGNYTMHRHAVTCAHMCTCGAHMHTCVVIQALSVLCLLVYNVSYCGYRLVFSPDDCGGCIGCWECNSRVHFLHEWNSK